MTTETVCRCHQAAATTGDRRVTRKATGRLSREEREAMVRQWLAPTGVLP